MNSGELTGPLTDPQDQTLKTAQSQSLTTGRELNNALNPGSAEELDSAREADGAQVMTAVKVLLSQTKLQVSPWITEGHESNWANVK